MAVMTATAARTNLYNLIDQAKDFHEPIIISGKRNNEAIISFVDWNLIEENFY